MVIDSLILCNKANAGEEKICLPLLLLLSRWLLSWQLSPPQAKVRLVRKVKGKGGGRELVPGEQPAREQRQTFFSSLGVFGFFHKKINEEVNHQ